MRTKKQLLIIILLFVTHVGLADELWKGETLTRTEVRDTIPSDSVHIALKKVSQEEVVGFVSKINTDKVAQYDHIIWGNDVFGGRTLGLHGDLRIRGIGRGISIDNISGNSESGNPAVIVDGLPRDMSTLRLSEIEEITVLRDVNSAVLYGSDAVNGVILVTTKRGSRNKKQADFSLNYGLSQPLELPQYLNSADYMTYYNQALENDELPGPLYDEATIENYRTGNRYRYPDVDYYSGEYMRSIKNYFDLNGQFSGGNEVASYYTNLGWNSQGSLLDFGQWNSARDNQFNVRGNANLKVNDFINTEVDVTGYFANANEPRGDYWGDAAKLRPNEYAPLLPMLLIDPTNELLKGRKNDVGGYYLLGGNKNNITTPFGDGFSAGMIERIRRQFSFNNRINVNLSSLTKGLTFQTNISFDYYTKYNQTISDDYSTYEPQWDAVDDLIVGLEQNGKDVRSGRQNAGGSHFRRRFGAYAQLAYDRTFHSDHKFTGNLLGFLNNYKQQDDFQGIKQANLGLRLGYAYQGKYLVDFSGAYLNSTKLAKGNRGDFSPTLGVAWIALNKNSSDDNRSGIIDYLKVRASGGILKSDFPVGGFFYYDNRYASSGSYAWNDGQKSRSGTKSSWGDNPNLGFTDRKEINLGAEGLFFDRKIGVQIGGFYDVYDNLVARPQTRYPDYYSDFIPYENFEANSYYGIEAGINYDQFFGDFRLYLGVNFLYSDSKRKKVDEIYEYDNLYKQGNPADARYGLVALGLFQDQDEIDQSPRQTYGTVRPGDIKYEDVNGDGVIDDNDIVMLGRYQAPFSGGLEVILSYKGLTLFALAQGETGRKEFLSGNYYWVDGNKKYSEVVLGSWTESNKEKATYPRLSTQSAGNNYRESSYWLYNRDLFRIRRVQLTYRLPSNLTDRFRMEGMSLFVDAYNVVQFAKNKKIINTVVGGEPNYRTFSAGVNLEF